MSTVVINRSPKKRFQESGGNISRHRDLLQTEDFTKAIDFALLQFQEELCTEPGDLNTCAAKHLRIQGAKEFVRILRNLAESPTATMAADIGNLDHRA